MKPVFPLSRTICFMLIQIILLNITKSEFSASLNNATDHTSLWKLSRSKRHIFHSMPSRITIYVKYATGEQIKLNWIKHESYLANEHLPVIAPLVDANLNVMKNLDDFVMYQDAKKCSAVVYFEKSNSFHGVIGTDYYIQNLPFNLVKNYEYRGFIEEPYVVRREYTFTHIHPNEVYPPPHDTEAWDDFLRPSPERTDVSNKSPSESDAASSTKRQRIDHGFAEQIENAVSTEENGESNIRIMNNYHYHFEILIFITRDVTEIFKLYYGNDYYVEMILKYYITYFNAVDMMITPLKRKKLELSINIAKIVIEHDSHPLHFVTDDEPQFTNIISKARQYLHTHSHEYPRDSFDHVFISTSRRIWDDSVLVNGMSKWGADLYEARSKNQFYDEVPISVVTLENLFANYLFTVLQIGRILNIKIEPQANGIKPIGQCSSIMQRDGAKCNHCLKWSDENVQQFNLFFQTNRNRCFLLNAPRSLQPPGIYKLSSAQKQCRCFNYDAHNTFICGTERSYVGMYNCLLPLYCRKIINKYISYHENTVYPFDGTPCTSKKVCWDGKCVLQSSPKINV